MNKKMLRQSGCIIATFLLMISTIAGDITPIYAASIKESETDDGILFEEACSSEKEEDTFTFFTEENITESAIDNTADATKISADMDNELGENIENDIEEDNKEKVLTPEGTATGYGIWVGNVELTETKPYVYAKSGGMVSYTPSDNHLKLSGDLTNIDGLHENSLIYIDNKYVIIEGTASLGYDGANTGVIGIRSIGSLAISPSADIDITLSGGGNSKYGIYVQDGNFRMIDRGKLNINVTTENSVGIRVDNALVNIYNGADVTISATRYGIEGYGTTSISIEKAKVDSRVSETNGVAIKIGKNGNLKVYDGITVIASAPASGGIAIGGNDAGPITIRASANVGSICAEGGWAAIYSGTSITLERGTKIKTPILGRISDDKKSIWDNYDSIAKNIEIELSETYYLWVGSTQVTEENCDNIPGILGGGKANYDFSTKTLTFSGNVTGVTGVYDTVYQIFSENDINIKGKAKLHNDSANIAVYSAGNLSIEGEFDLLSQYAVIMTGGDIKLKGNITLEPAISSVSIASGKDIVIDGGNISAKGKGTRAISAPYGSIKINSGIIESEAIGDSYSNPNSAIEAHQIIMSDDLEIVIPDGGKVSNNKHYIAESDGTTGALKVLIEPKGPKYTVAFDANGHGTAPSNQTVKENHKAKEPEPLVADDYKFGGWYTSSACKDNEKYDFSSPVLGYLTLYAKWTEITYFTVAFNLNGEDGTVPVAQIIKEGEKAKKPAIPIVKDKEFGGWFMDKECTKPFDFDTPIIEDITLYAKWKEIHSSLDMNPRLDITDELWLVKGQKFTLDKEWVSSNTNVLLVSKKGVVTAKNKGEAELKKGDKTFKVYVYNPTVPKKISLDAGKTETISISDYNREKMSVLFYSASPDVATVDSTGIVTAVAKGKAKISAYINGKAFNCNVTVKEPTTAKERTLHINVNSAKTINIKGLKKAKWNQSNNILNIWNSKVKGIKAGKTVLTASANGIAYKVNVTVEDITVSGEGITPGKPNKYTLNLKKGQATDIKLAEVYQTVLFRSNKPDIAFIDEKGHIEARGKGKCKLTSKVNGKAITIKVNVTE